MKKKKKKKKKKKDRSRDSVDLLGMYVDIFY